MKLAMLLAASSLGTAAGVCERRTDVTASCEGTPLVAYFRQDNWDNSTALDVVALSSDAAEAASVVLRSWDVDLRIFDSARALRMQRLDVYGTPGARISLYNSSSVSTLYLDGEVAFFHNATRVSLFDAVSGAEAVSGYENATAWASAGACLGLALTLPATGNASIYAVSSGDIAWGGVEGAASTAACGAVPATLLVGAEGKGAGGGQMRNNPVEYELETPASCTVAASHGDTSYSLLDEVRAKKKEARVRWSGVFSLDKRHARRSTAHSIDLD